MYRFLVVLFLIVVSLNGSILEQKVENIIGKKDFQTHKSLLKLLLSDQNRYIVNDRINYYNLFKTLQQNGLLNLRRNKPTEINIEFKILNRNIKAYKILNDAMQSLGYRYYFTKLLEYNKDSLIWKIVFKAEYMLDPVMFLKELRNNDCKVTNVENKQTNNWLYEVDFSDSKVDRAVKIQKNEKVRFQKPLRAFFLKVEDPKSLQIISRNLNNWFPHIVFFDKDLRVLQAVKKDRIYKGFKIKTPIQTKYIKITDLYNLINIKRGLTIIVR